MKSIHIVILILVLAVLGFLVFKNNDTKMKDDMGHMEMGDMNNNTYAPDTSSGTAVVTTTTVTTETTPTVREFTVTAKNFSFLPSSMTVNKGDTVKITFKNTEGFHDLVLPEFNVKSKQGQGPFEETLTFTADKTGSFEYYCSVGQHRAMGMKGTFTVK